MAAREPAARVRRAAALVGAGLAVQLGAALHWTPGTFVVAALVGLPLVLLGAGLFLRAVVAVLKDKGAL